MTQRVSIAKKLTIIIIIIIIIIILMFHYIVNNFANRAPRIMSNWTICVVACMN